MQIVAASVLDFEGLVWESTAEAETPVLETVSLPFAARRFVVVVAAPTFAVVGVAPAFAVGVADSAYLDFVLARLPVLASAFAAACWAYSCWLSFARNAVVTCSGCLVAASFQPCFAAVGVAETGERAVFAASLLVAAVVAIEQTTFGLGSVAETLDWAAEAQDGPSRVHLVLMRLVLEAYRQESGLA